MKKSIVFKIFDKSGQQVELKEFDKNQVVLGHQAEVDLDLESSEVAPIHALVEKREDGYYLCDLGSQAGTLLNGEAVLDHLLKEGDEIQIGPYRIEFSLGSVKGQDVTEDLPPPPPPIPDVDEDSSDEVFSQPVKSQLPSSPPPSVDSDEVVEAPLGEGTYAPGSFYQSVKDIVQAEKGSVVQVLLVWQERILESHHFSEKQSVKVGTSQSNDVVVPLNTGNRSQSFFKIDHGGVILNLTPDMRGELISKGQASSLSDLAKTSRMEKKGRYHRLRLQQGEMICVEVSPGGVMLCVRYVPETPAPALAPSLSMSSSEITGIILSFILVGLLALYMVLYGTPEAPEEEKKEVTRVATFIYKAPKKAPPKIVKPKKEAKKAVPKKVTKKEPKKKLKPAKVRKVKTAGRKSKDKRLKRGKPAQVRKSKVKRTRPKKFTSSKSGGSKKVGGKAGAGAKSRRKDPTKTGLLGTFGGKGINEDLSKTYSGKGDLIGIADSATGRSGGGENRAGRGMGTSLKNTGSTGKGVAIEGVDGIKTTGRSSGQGGYGKTSLGGKSTVQVVPGGKEIEITGSVDKDAVYRVLKQGYSEIRSCYERALNRKSRLNGKITVYWTVLERGRVTNVKLKSRKLRDRGLQDCIKRRFMSWRFPEPPAGNAYEVIYSYIFSPAGRGR